MANQADGNPTADRGFEKVIPHSPYVPYDPDVRLYVGTMRKFLVPYEYTGWRDETMAWKESCYLHGNLNPTPTFRIKGPDALKFLSDTCVNGFSRFPAGPASTPSCVGKMVSSCRTAYCCDWPRTISSPTGWHRTLSTRWKRANIMP